MPEKIATSADKARAASAARRQAAARQAAARQAMQARPGKEPGASPARPAASSSQADPRPEPVARHAAEQPSERELDTLCEIVERDPTALGAEANSVRQLCRDRRRVLATQGKSALPRKARSDSVVGVSRGKPVEANGREAARQRRAELCQNGRGEAPACRPSGRTRPKLGEAPAKVETGTTLAGRIVTGTQVERIARVTGNESGTCRTITGTEYIGSEQYETFCGERPTPPVGKVGVSATSRGQWVSGSEVGRSIKVTGDESGSCRPVTGTEYLGSERFEQFCRDKGLVERPEKVVAGATERKGVTITGSDEARVNRATGAEAGASRAITGAQYSDAGAARLTINGPSKVALTHTLAGRPVSGSEVGRSPKVTGDEAGGCRAISGIEYLSNEQFQSICHSLPAPAPAKVGVTHTGHGQAVSGTPLGRSQRVTGNEPGSALPISGTPYASLEQTGGEAGCGGDGCTGACGCAARHGTATTTVHPRYQAPAGLPSAEATVIVRSAPAPADFSIVSPARDARSRITGNAFGGAGRITGPVNMAAGLVSGTPEFRYRDETGTLRMPTPAAQVEAAQALRITGEGREDGERITGDDWARSGRVTGTEGRWAQGRNPTLRGEARAMAAGAWGNKDRERPEAPPPARVTGSSGNAGKGAMITVSGGARA